MNQVSGEPVTELMPRICIPVRAFAYARLSCDAAARAGSRTSRNRIGGSVGVCAASSPPVSRSMAGARMDNSLVYDAARLWNVAII